MKALFRALFVLCALLFVRAAHAYAPPANEGPVTDSAGKLSITEVGKLSQKIRAIKESTGYEVTVFLPSSLEGNAIEDVSFATARAWKLGSKMKDNGALLVIATKERKIRIETAKGVDGSLTDLQCAEIIRDTIGPRMKQDRVYDALDAGVDAIVSEIRKGGGMAPADSAKPAPKPATGKDLVVGFAVLAITVVIIFFLPLLFVFLIIRGIWNAMRGGRSGGYGSSYGPGYVDNSWSTGTSSWSSGDSSSSDSGGGGDWGGGGGDWGGGGASGDY